MLKVEKDTRLHTVITVVDQHRAALQERAVPFKSQVEHGVEERVSGTNEGRVRLSPRRDERLFERDALVAGGHRLCGPYVIGAPSHRRGHPRDLIPPRLPLPGGPTEVLEGLQEERLDEMGL